MFRIALCDDNEQFIKFENEIIQDYFLSSGENCSIDSYNCGADLIKEDGNYLRSRLLSIRHMEQKYYEEKKNMGSYINIGLVSDTINFVYNSINLFNNQVEIRLKHIVCPTDYNYNGWECINGENSTIVEALNYCLENNMA